MQEMLQNVHWTEWCKKIKEERTVKIVEEFTEKNVHGF